MTNNPRRVLAFRLEIAGTKNRPKKVGHPKNTLIHFTQPRVHGGGFCVFGVFGPSLWSSWSCLALQGGERDDEKQLAVIHLLSYLT